MPICNQENKKTNCQEIFLKNIKTGYENLYDKV